MRTLLIAVFLVPLLAVNVGADTGNRDGSTAKGIVRRPQ